MTCRATKSHFRRGRRRRDLAPAVEMPRPALRADADSCGLSRRLGVAHGALARRCAVHARCADRRAAVDPAGSAAGAGGHGFGAFWTLAVRADLHQSRAARPDAGLCRVRRGREARNPAGRAAPVGRAPRAHCPRSSRRAADEECCREPSGGAGSRVGRGCRHRRIPSVHDCDRRAGKRCYTRTRCTPALVSVGATQRHPARDTADNP